MPDVICLGEMLIDFVATESGVSLIDAPGFKKAPGGAPANVAVGLARFGHRVGFMGKLGADDFGQFLTQTLAENGVDTSTICYSQTARTALAFVALAPDGEREFMFYRHPSAGMLFEPDEVDELVLGQIKLFHFGSLTLISEPARSATLHAARLAQEAGAIISYDPNLRLNLWPDAEQARQGMQVGWPYAQVAKVSREELSFLSAEDDLAAGINALWHDGLRILLVTDGPNGAWAVTGSGRLHVPGFAVKAIDTTGAGDGFTAGFLHRLLHEPGLVDEPSRIEDAVRFANAVGALTTTMRGAIPGLPTLDAVNTLLSQNRE
ncbi:MAG: fructokinase [Chloroflexi bacterium]|nr:fructokinase [Chloroflexota bacterium]